MIWPTIRSKKPVVVAMGVFDGVHVGHQSVLKRVREEASRIGGVSAVVAFATHPLMVLHPRSAPPTLTTPEQKARLLARQGITYPFVVWFTRRLARVKAEEFLKTFLVKRMNVKCLIVGANFNFGHRREGNVSYLRRVGPALGCRVRVVSAVQRQGERVSSTRIRRVIQKGRVEEANALLGRPHAVEGRVERGDQRGRKLGYPTANVDVRAHLLPKRGVYIVRARPRTPNRSTPAQWGVANVGVRPTIRKAAASLDQLEVHLLDWKGTLYGRSLQVEFYRRLRPEKRFPHLQALRAQIQRDERLARQWIQGRRSPKMQLA